MSPGREDCTRTADTATCGLTRTAAVRSGRCCLTLQHRLPISACSVRRCSTDRCSCPRRLHTECTVVSVAREPPPFYVRSTRRGRTAARTFYRLRRTSLSHLTPYYRCQASQPLPAGPRLAINQAATAAYHTRILQNHGSNHDTSMHHCCTTLSTAHRITSTVRLTSVILVEHYTSLLPQSTAPTATFNLLQLFNS